jgi:hypothetical protein
LKVLKFFGIDRPVVLLLLKFVLILFLLELLEPFPLEFLLAAFFSFDELLVIMGAFGDIHS